MPPLGRFSKKVDLMRSNYAALRIADAEIQQHLLMKEQLLAERKKRKISYCVHTDFNALRDTSESEEEKLRNF